MRSVRFSDNFLNSRSSHRRCSVRKDVLRNFANFTGKHLCLGPATLLKKRLWHSCFQENFKKFPRTLFLQNTFGRRLLKFAVIFRLLPVRNTPSTLDNTLLSVSNKESCKTMRTVDLP